jgi:VanZ family protein
MDSGIGAPQRSLLYKVLRYWVPVVTMLALMAYFSTDVFSGDNTRSVIESIVLWLWPHISHHAINELNHYVRKTAHFTEYAVFAALVFRAMRADSALLWKLSWFIGSFLVVAIWSLLDELHQAFTRTRGASIYDSMLDSAGGLFALIVITLIAKRRRAPTKLADR